MKINNKLIKKLYNCVVRITSQKIKFNWNNPSDKTEEGHGVGTGFFINKKGDILTCWHVIAESNENYINIPGIEKKYKCEVISVCPYLDLALINVKDYKPKDFLTLGNSDKFVVPDIYKILNIALIFYLRKIYNFFICITFLNIRCKFITFIIKFKYLIFYFF